MLDRAEQPPRRDVVDPALHRQRALPHLRDDDVGIEQLGDDLGSTQPVKRDRGDDCGIELGGLAQTGLDVAAQAGELKVGAQRSQLRAPAH